MSTESLRAAALPTDAIAPAGLSDSLAHTPHGAAIPTDPTPAKAIEVDARRLALGFGGVVLGLVVVHVVCQYLRYATGDDRLLGLVPLFNVGTERNLPTFYSTFAMLFCAGLLSLVAVSVRDKVASGLYWWGLSVLFVFLSIDEMLSLHEHLIERVRTALGTSGVFYYAWVIPYGGFALLIAGLYSRFLWRLPRRTALLFVAAGATFVSGAIGLEMLGGYWREAHGKGPVYTTLQTIEETLEMAGVVVFIYAISDYVQRHLDLRLCFKAASRGPGSR